MGRILITSLILFVFLAIPAFPGIAHAGMEFSADLVMAPKGDKPMTGKIFVKGDKIREETADGDKTQILILRPDKKVTWMIRPEEKRCFEMPYQPSDNKLEEWTAVEEKNAKFLGEETVSGMPCKKYETMEDGERTVFWISERFSLPVKVENQDETIEYRNIKLDRLDDSLFELPHGYEKTVTKIAPSEE